MKIEIDRRSQAILELLSKRFGVSMEAQLNEAILGHSKIRGILLTREELVLMKALWRSDPDE